MDKDDNGVAQPSGVLAAALEAVSEALGRLRFGAVADFFDVHVAGWHWPAFNVADAAIAVGSPTDRPI